MMDRYRIFKQIIATGSEWKPCVDCGKRFGFGEIITAIEWYDGRVTYYYCSKCTEECFDDYDDELGLQPPPDASPFKLVKLDPETKTCEVFDGQQNTPKHEKEKTTYERRYIVGSQRLLRKTS